MSRASIAVVAVVVLLGFGASAARAQQFYTDETAFVAALAPAFYLEDFATLPGGSIGTTWDAPGANGFGWTASAPLGLWGVAGQFIGATNTHDLLTFTFTGNPVTAFGGDFWGTNFADDPITAEVTFTTNTSETFSHTVSVPTFLGFVSPVPLASVTIDATQIGVNAWPTADNVYTGQRLGVDQPSILEIPFLSQVMLGLLSVLMAAFGVLAMRRLAS